MSNAPARTVSLSVSQAVGYDRIRPQNVAFRSRWIGSRRVVSARTPPENEMLQLRPNCECCNTDLPPDSAAAKICSFECTFCTACAQGVLANRCPNCGGELVMRPGRPTP